MAYSTRADVERWGGSDNVAKWGSLGPSDSASVVEARITSMIASADAEIDGTLADIYTTPLSGGSVLLNDISAKLAAANLYYARGGEDTDENGQTRNPVTKNEKTAREMLGRIVGRFVDLPGEQSLSGTYETPHM